MAKRLSQNTLILLVSNVGSAILSFLLAVLIGRYYGDNGLGLYAGVLAWIFPLSFIVEFGFGTLITREVAQDFDIAYVYLKLTWHFRLIVGTCLIVILCILSSIISSHPSGLILSSPLIIILPAYSAYTAIFRAHQRMIPIALLNIGMLIAQVTLTAFVMIAQADLVWLFIINTLTSSGQCLTARQIYRTHFYRKPKTAVNIRLLDIVKQARAFAIAGILSAIQARFSILWLETVSTPMIVGLFVASLRFIDGARMIPNAVFGAVYPALSALSDDRAALHRLFLRVVLSLGIYSLLVAGILGYFADAILRLTFGRDFLEASLALGVLGLALIPFVVRSTWSLYWYAIGREQAVNYILILNLFILVITSYFAYHAGTNALYSISYAILLTEIFTFIAVITGEIILWRRNTSSTVSS